MEKNKERTWLGPVLVVITLPVISCTTTGESVKNENTLGKQVFDENCSYCHHYPDDLKDPKEFLSRTVHKGGERMPSFAAKLTREEEEAVVDYILSQ